LSTRQSLGALLSPGSPDGVFSSGLNTANNNTTSEDATEWQDSSVYSIVNL